jgi:hypothetical protein
MLTVAAFALSGCLDNMYPTATTEPDWGKCNDGGGEPYSAHYCQTDNELLRVALDNDDDSDIDLKRFEVETQMISSVLDQQFSPTDLVVEWESPVYTGDAETDIIYQWDTLDAEVLGTAWCNDAKNDTYECDQHYVRFNSDNNPTGKLVCHETGHAVGLTHGENANPVTANDDPVLGCMTTDNALSSLLGEQNVKMINDTYPHPSEDDGNA